MIDGIVGAIQTVLAGANTSRSFTVQVSQSTHLEDMAFPRTSAL